MRLAKIIEPNGLQKAAALRRAAADAEMRDRYPTGGTVLTDTHAHQARIANIPLDVTSYAERIRVAAARAAATDEIGGLDVQQRMAARIFREIMSEMAPSMEANDALQIRRT